MPFERASGRCLLRVEALEDVQPDQGRDALTIGRDLGDRGPAVVGRDGLHPGGRVLGQILVAEAAAELA